MMALPRQRKFIRRHRAFHTFDQPISRSADQPIGPLIDIDSIERCSDDTARGELFESNLTEEERLLSFCLF